LGVQTPGALSATALMVEAWRIRTVSLLC